MTRCEDFQDRLLDDLYGLLDAADSRELLEHTEHCPACREALAKAQVQRRLLTVAARRDFANLRFAPPTTRHTRPAAQHLPQLRGVNWTAYALAAAILLAMAGLGWPEVSYWHQARNASLAETRYTRLEEQLARLDQARKDAIAPRERALAEARHNLKLKLDERQQQLAGAQKDLRRLKEQRERKLSEINQTLAKRDLNLVVTGPPAPEAGAANHYDVRILDKANQPVAAKVSAQVVDSKSQGVLYEQQGIATRGSVQFHLPASLPLKPRTDLKLVVKAEKTSGTQAELQETLSLVAPVYLTHLTTDKPMYRPGEVVHFRSLTLERFSLKPADADLDLVYSVTTPSGERKEILRGSAGPIDEQTGASILGPDGKPVQGVGCGDYAIDPKAPGGKYALTVSEAGNRFPPQQRKFTVGRYGKPLLNKEFQFAKKAYGPGEAVTAVCRATRPTGEPLAHSAATSTVDVDGVRYGSDGEPSTTPIQARTDQDGAARIRFALPRQIERGQAQLAVTFHDGAVVESIVRPIPLTLKKLQVEFFPEGGRLVAWVPNRVYFQATTALDKPAELKGRIVDDRGRMVVSHVETLNDPDQPGVNQGMGSFTLTPEPGRRYELKIDLPLGIEGRHELPGVDADGVVLSVPDGVTKDGAPIRVNLWSGQLDRSLLVGAYCRGRLMAQRQVEAKKGRMGEIELRPQAGAGGVYRITVFEMVNGDPSHLEPRAERLIYRVCPEHLNIAIRPEKARYSPGERVKLQLQAHNEKGQPAAAVLMLAVTDKSLLKLAEEKAFQVLPTHFLLMTEVRRPEDLEFADFLLSDHPKASQALDLVLGTQGWRRFAEQAPRQLQNQEKEAVAFLGGGRAHANEAAVVIDTGSEERRQAMKRFDDQAQAMLATISKLRPEIKSAGSLLEAASTKPGARGQAAVDGRAGGAEAQSASVGKSDLRELEDRLARAETELMIASGEDPDSSTRSRLREEVKEANIEHWKLRGRLQDAAEWVPDTESAMLPLTALGVMVVGLVFLSLTWIRSGSGLSWSRLVGWGLITCGLATYVALHSSLGPRQARKPYGVRGTVAQVRRLGPRGTGRRRPRNFLSPSARRREEALKAAAAPPAQTSDHAATEPQAAGTAGGRARDNAGLAEPVVGQPAPAPRSASPSFAANAAKKDATRLPPLEGANPEAERANRSRGQESESARQMQVSKAMQPQRPSAATRALATRAGANKQELDAPSRTELDRFEQSTVMEKWINGSSGAGGAAASRELQDRAPGLRLEYWLQPPLVAREYAHLRTSGGKAAEDRAETLYWHPVFVLADGKGEASFDLPDSVTTFQVLAAGHTLDGRLGAVTVDLTSQPHRSQSKPPSEQPSR
jgi:hypothetical protein